MTGFSDIQGALMTAWQTVPLSHPVAYEGVDFVPPDAAPWVAPHTLPASVRSAALGKGAPIEHTGILQVDLNHPLNTGTGPILADADVVASVFRPGATFDRAGVRLRIESCGRSQILRDDAWQKLFLSIHWRTWTFA